MPRKKKTCKVSKIEAAASKLIEVVCKNIATRKWHGCSVCQKHYEKLTILEQKNLVSSSKRTAFDTDSFIRVNVSEL